jgi:hypothetical protein
MSGKGKTMRVFTALALAGSVLIAPLAEAQDDSSEIIVTAQRRESRMPSVITQLPYLDRRPVIGLKRQADSAVRNIEIVSDSRDSDMRKHEVEAMLLAALDRAKKEGLSLVVGQYEVTEVTRENWRTQFPALAKKDDSDEEDEDDSDDDDDDNNVKPKPGFEDDGSNATVRLMVKTKLEGTIAEAQKKISSFVKGVPATGRSLITQKGQMALTIVNPEQYRDEIYRRIAESTKHAVGFYGTDYGANISGLDREIAWAQVSNTQVFLYIPYSFTVAK